MESWTNFEKLFLPESKKQAEVMLMFIVLCVRTALVHLPQNDENSMSRASLYVGLALALNYKMVGLDTLEDFLARCREPGKLTPEQQHELHEIWALLKEGIAAQDGSCAPDSET